MAEAKVVQVPDSYRTMYPSRFLYSDMLKGKKVTLTIKTILGEELTGDDEKKKQGWILYFVETPRQLVIPKVNGECLRRMFGNDPHASIGKRLTIFPSTTVAFGKKVDAIRIWGSPDLETDMDISVRDGGSRKPKEMRMHKVSAGECGFKGGPSVVAPLMASAPVATDPEPDSPVVTNPDADLIDYPEPERDDEGNPQYNFGQE